MNSREVTHPYKSQLYNYRSSVADSHWNGYFRLTRCGLHHGGLMNDDFQQWRKNGAHTIMYYVNKEHWDHPNQDTLSVRHFLNQLDIVLFQNF